MEDALSETSVLRVCVGDQPAGYFLFADRTSVSVAISASTVTNPLEVLDRSGQLTPEPRLLSLHAALPMCAVLLRRFCVMAGALALQAKAQTCGANAQSPIATDRPQITSSSIVVPCGSLQFENGFQETSNGGQRTYDLPETAVRFGIASKTELRFAAPDYFFNDDTASGFASGFADLSLGFKQQLGPTRGGFDVSLIPSVSLPTGANLISSHGYDPTVQLPWSRSLSKNWTAAGMFSAHVANRGSAAKSDRPVQRVL